MADSNVRSNPVNIEQIMEQIRGRIRDQHGVQYTEQQLQELAATQLEKFLDPRKVRSNLLEEFRRMRAAALAPDSAPEAVDDAALFQTGSGFVRAIRFLLRPFTRLLLNTRALATVLAQSQAEKSRRTRDQLLFELAHNLVVETARLNVELKNLKMRNESLAGRVEFNERRVRGLEASVSAHQPARTDSAPERPASSMSGSSGTSVPPADSQQERIHQQTPGIPGDGPGQRRRRRRRRGRRGGGPPPAAGIASSTPPGQGADNPHIESPSPRSTTEETTHDDSGDSEGNDGGSDAGPQ